MKKDFPYFILICSLILFDQVTKWVVVRGVPLYGTRTVVPGFFSITHIRNKGAIFGFFSQAGGRLVFPVLIAASLFALALVIYYFIKTPAAERSMKLALSLILAGALGNQVDRLARGYVIDFLDLSIRNRHWPFFNVADSCITVGAVLLLIRLLIRKPSCSPSSSESVR